MTMRYTDEKFAAELLKMIKSVENDYQSAISDNYHKMSDTTFKGMGCEIFYDTWTNSRLKSNLFLTAEYIISEHSSFLNVLISIWTLSLRYITVQVNLIKVNLMKLQWIVNIALIKILSLCVCSIFIPLKLYGVNCLWRERKLIGRNYWVIKLAKKQRKHPWINM